MFDIKFLYDFSNIELDLVNNENHKNDLLRIALFGTLEAKSLLLFKIKNTLNEYNYQIVLEAINLIIDNTKLNQTNEIIFKYCIDLTKKILSFIKPKTTEYFKIILTVIKLVNIVSNKISTNELIKLMLEKIEEIDKEIFLRHIFSKIQTKSLNYLSDKVLNLMISNILEEKESKISNYRLFFHNISYAPYVNKISLENILKITQKLNNNKQKIKSLKLREIFINIICNYFKNIDIGYLIENSNLFQTNVFLQHLFIKKLIKEMQENPTLINEQKVKILLSKLSIKSPSLVRKTLINQEILPLYVRTNSYKVRKYNVEQIKNYYIK